MLKKTVSLLTAITMTLLFMLPCFSEEFETSAKSVILVEASTGKVLYEMNPDEPLPPASVTKIMTLLLVLEAVDEGKISLDDEVSTSERAAGMGGSQVYLEPGETMTVDELLKCVAVASANDAAASLAEYVAGSLEAFVTMMNRRAAQLGMSHTHFENTNGLDDTTTSHLTSASDIAIMSMELLKHDKIFDYTGIWMDTVRNGEFGLTNTNRLIRFYKGANGLKTGSTSKAGFCISATAKRDGMQLIAVVMGSPTRDERNKTASALLDYGFANYETYDAPDPALTSLPVIGGREESVGITSKGLHLLLSKGEGKKITVEMELPDQLAAPLKEGEIVGKQRLLIDGKMIGETDITVESEVTRLSFGDVLKKMLDACTFF